MSEATQIDPHGNPLTEPQPALVPAPIPTPAAASHEEEAALSPAASSLEVRNPRTGLRDYTLPVTTDADLQVALLHPRPQTADRRPQTADRRPHTAYRRP